MTPEQKAELRKWAEDRAAAILPSPNPDSYSDATLYRDAVDDNDTERFRAAHFFFEERLRVQPLIEAVGDTISLLKSISRGDNYEQIDTQQAELIAAVTAYQNTER